MSAPWACSPGFTATSSGGGETNTGNNPASPMTPTTPVAGVPDLTTSIGQPSPNFVVGVASNVPLTVTNSGTTTTTGTITATMTLPAGTSAPASFSDGPWSCTTSAQTVTCTQPGPIVTGGSSTLQVPVTPDVSTVGMQPVFTATSSGGGETNTGNNPASPMTPTTPVAGVPDLTTSIGQPSPNFVVGVASNVPLTVTNSGTTTTTGTITATMTLPAGTSAPASFSDGPWSCTTSAQTVTCTQPGPITTGGSSTLQVPVTPDVSTVGMQPVFTATSSGGGETNTGNNPASPMTPTTPVAGVPDYDEHWPALAQLCRGRSEQRTADGDQQRHHDDHRYDYSDDDAARRHQCASQLQRWAVELHDQRSNCQLHATRPDHHRWQQHTASTSHAGCQHGGHAARVQRHQQWWR